MIGTATSQNQILGLAPNLHQMGKWWHKENPETVVVSGFLNVLKDNRLSLGVMTLLFYPVYIV